MLWTVKLKQVVCILVYSVAEKEKLGKYVTKTNCVVGKEPKKKKMVPVRSWYEWCGLGRTDTVCRLAS